MMNSTTYTGFASKPESAHAFTLIELITGIAIIAILAAILIPAIGSARDKAASAKAINSARQIGLANILYSQDNQGAIIGCEEGNYMGPMQAFAKYISEQDSPSWAQQIAALIQVVDPSVPEEFSKAAGLPFTWSINSVFNVKYGRAVEGKAAWGPTSSMASNPRRMTEFENPADTIYAVSGDYELTEAYARDASLTNEPTGRQRIFYYHGNNDSTPAVFLDGHTELLTYPIAVERINPARR